MTTQLHNGPVDQGRFRAVSTTAVVSLVFGVLSVLTVFGWYLAIVPAVGISLGWLAAQRIQQYPSELTGLGIARAGVRVSLVLWVLSYGWLIFQQVKEFPWGYAVISYEELQPEPGEDVSQRARDMDGELVGIRGYISPGRQQVGLKRFVLCPIIGDCGFCTADPKPTEMIRVRLAGDLRIRYTTRLIRVGGRLTVDPNAPGGVPYFLDADYVR